MIVDKPALQKGLPYINVTRTEVRGMINKRKHQVVAVPNNNVMQSRGVQKLKLISGPDSD
jgi:hypothetical protein